MTNIIFQLYPLDNSGYKDVRIDLDQSHSEEQGNGGLALQSVNLDSGREIEVGRLGNIRYSEDIDTLADGDLQDMLDRCFETIPENLSNLADEYGVSMIIRSDDAPGELISNHSKIRKFRKDQFNDEDLEYTEISSHSIKVTLGDINGVIKAEA